MPEIAEERSRKCLLQTRKFSNAIALESGVIGVDIWTNESVFCLSAQGGDCHGPNRQPKPADLVDAAPAQ